MKVRIGSVIFVLIIWWVVGQSTSDLIPGPFEVFDRFVELVETGELPTALRIGVSALVYGGALSIVIGIPLGILMGIWKPLAELLEHYFTGMYVMPMSAVVPLFVLWFGFDLNVRVIFIVIFTIPQVVITCYQGARNMPDNMIEVARAFRARQRDVFFKVIIPYEIPFIITALRLAVGRAIQGMVVAELLIGGTKGIGVMIRNYSANLELDNTLAIVLFIMLMGIIATTIVRWIEGALAPWQKELSARGGK